MLCLVGFDFISLTAPLAGGLAMLLLAGRTLPALAARSTASARLRTFVGEPPPGRAAAPGRRRLLPRDRPTWVAGRELTLAALLVATTAVHVLTGQVLLTIAATCQVLMFSGLLGQQLLAARSRMLDVQTLPTVLRLAAIMRAGGSLGQAIEAVAHDGPAPTRDEFARATHEIELGTSMDAALDRLAARVGTADYAILAHVLTVQRRVGGNLPMVLDTIAETIRQRIEVRREIATLTAQQRLSTWVLVILPYLVLMLFMLADRTYLTPLFTTEAGERLVLVAAVMQMFGSLALRLAGRIPA
jgi:tight adherence protein B